MKETITSFEELNNEIISYQKSHGCELYIAKSCPLSDVRNENNQSAKEANCSLRFSEIIYKCEYGRQLCKRYPDSTSEAARQCPFEIVAKTATDQQTFVINIAGDHTHTTYKENFLEDAKSTFKKICNKSTITGADILFCNWSDPNVICSLRIKRSQRDLNNLEKRQFIQDVHLEWNPDTQSLKRYMLMPFPVEVTKVLISQLSKCGSSLATIRKSSKGENDNFLLEVFCGDSMINSIHLSKADQHGIVHGGVDFSNIQWSVCGEKLIYLCERKPNEDQSYFNEKSNKIGTKGAKFNHESDFGEQLINQKRTIISLCDLKKSTITVIDCVPEDVAVTEICWTDENEIYFIGVFAEPYALGKIYCLNRRCGLFKINIREDVCDQIINDVTLFGLRKSPDCTKLIYFSKPYGGPHRSSSNLMMYSLESRTESLLYGTVNEHPDIKIGLFTTGFIKNCWMDDNKTIVFDNQVKTRIIIYAFDTESKELTMLSGKDGNWTLMDLKDGFVLANYQNPNDSGCVKFGMLNEDKTIRWNTIDFNHHDDPAIACINSEFSWQIITSKLGDYNMDSILYLPHNDNSTKKPPLIVCPHGGPHGAFTQAFMSYHAAFCMLGYAVLLVNYRGSTGFGDESLRSLLGKIGTQDLEDMQAVVQQVAETGLVDDSNKYLFGGSHGGFLSCHLAGDGKSSYRACAMRNPVIDVLSMLQTTDIPDWCCVEAGIPFEFSVLPTVDDFKVFQKCSPIYNADKINCPVLLLVGEDDARVPSTQARQLYRYLRSIGKHVMLRTYPKNCHPLNGVEAEADVFMTVVKWFASHYE